MRSRITQETKETIVISFTNFLLGVCVMLGALAYYKNFTPINVGGVFNLVVGLLSLLLILGIGILVFRNNDSVRRVTDILYFRISRPYNIIGIVAISCVLLIFLVASASQRYPFFGAQSFLYGGILALYGLYTLITVKYLIISKAWVIGFIGGLKGKTNFLDNHVLIGIFLFGIIMFTYRNSFEGALLRLDDLFMIDFARKASPFAAITRPPEIYSVFYRPMHNLVLWVYYNLFGFDYAKYQLAELLGHYAVVLLIYVLLYSIIRDKLIALIGAIVFGTHIYISVGVVYVNAVFWWLGVFGVIVIMHMAKGRRLRWFSWLSLGVILLLILLLGEYGFALIGATWLLALYVILFEKNNFRYAISLAILGLLVVAIYFVLRWQAVGVLPESGGGSSGYYWNFYLNPRSLGFKYYIYTVIVNFISVFIPIFSQVGVLLLPSVIQILSGVIIFSIYIISLRKTTDNSLNVYLWLPVLFIYLIGSKEIVKHLIGNYNLSLSFSLHTMLNMAIAFLVLNWKDISKPHKAISIYALGLILGSSVVAFAYFRWRTHYYSVMGWILLIAIGITYLRRMRTGQAIVVCLLVISMVMSWKSMKIIDSRLPAIKIEEFQQNLCDTRVPKDLALDVVSYYDIESDPILICISEK